MTRIYSYEYFPSKPGIIGKLQAYYSLLRIRLLKKRKPLSNDEIRAYAEQHKELVIQVMYGGLGDHLIYSSLPRLLWEQKGIKTYISEKSLFRNEEIKNFVWGHNPFISFTSKKGWFNNPSVKINETIIYDHYFQDLFDLVGERRPEIYYKPKVFPSVQNKVIIDASFGPAGILNGYTEQEFIDQTIEFIQKNIPSFVLVEHEHTNSMHNELEKKLIENFSPERITVSNLEQLSDVLYSARERYLMYSGTASVAAGLNLPSIIFCNRKTNPRFQYAVNTYLSIIQSNA